MAIQANVTQTTHTHDSTGLNGPRLLQANTHQSADTDTGLNSIHHTLGVGQFQAATGNHAHAQYVDLTTPQTISGKKTFPSGTNSVAIPDFTHAVHHHTSTADGGLVFPVVGNQQTSAFTVANGGAVKANITGSFVLPNGYSLQGVVFVQARAVQVGASVKLNMTVSYGPATVTYADIENMTAAGNNFGIITSSQNEVCWQVGAQAGGTSAVIPIPFFGNATTNHITGIGTSALQLKLYAKNTGDGDISVGNAFVQYFITPTATMPSNLWNAAAAL